MEYNDIILKLLKGDIMNMNFNNQFDGFYSSKQDNEKYNKWCKDYIEGLDLTKIEWKHFNCYELMKFYYKNYFDEDYQTFVMERDEDNNFVPFGMKYLTINPNSTREQYILGLCENSNGTKTIVSSLTYDPYYVADRKILIPFTYIKMVETNRFFQNQGVFNKMCEQIINFVNKNQDIIIIPEGGIGCFVHVINHIKQALINNGFPQEVICKTELNEKHYEKIMK